MVYGIIHDKAAGRARYTVDNGEILDEDCTLVGTERDGIAYRMSGEVWCSLEDLESKAGLARPPEALRPEDPDL